MKMPRNVEIPKYTSNELFTEQKDGTREDIHLHSQMLDTADETEILRETREVMSAMGLSEEELLLLYGNSQAASVG